jgi:hypothetical protein
LLTPDFGRVEPLLKSLRLVVSPILLARSDEVIEYAQNLADASDVGSIAENHCVATFRPVAIFDEMTRS